MYDRETPMNNAERSATNKESLPSDTLIDQRYLVQGLLGRGGMGYVYRVLDMARGRVVALKQLSLGASGTVMSSHDPTRARLGQRTAHDARRQAQRIALFRGEFHTLAELAHPHIISAYDYGFHEGQPYYTMELLAGNDVGQRAPLAWPRVSEVLRAVASALSVLHARRLLHRDISPSNVHQQQDGTYKLIDFGAMGPMGVCNGIVGTPPFMAPEVLRQEALDTRTDLYSLGALGFYLLTGRTVYPARTVAELMDYVGARPSPPSAYAPHVPEMLDQLVLQLLSPERGARPETSIEVIERLSAILDGDTSGQHAASRMFLAAPALVGRGAQLASMRRHCLRAKRGKGASVLLTGPAGSGRTRLLDACSLEGKLSGALVLRADAESRDASPLSTWRTLLLGLHASLGARERARLCPSALVLGSLLKGFDWNGVNAASSRARVSNQHTAIADLGAVQQELRAFIDTVASERPLLLAIDDVERLDPASLQLLDALAARAHASKLSIVATLDEESIASASETLRALLLHSHRLTLTPLPLAETETLLASVFGHVPNLGAVAHRVHALSAGNPRLSMELAQHLVDCEAIRFEGAGFVLPDALSESTLPENLGDVLRARLERLSPQALALCSVLALALGMPITDQESFALAQLSESAGEAALNELCAGCMAERRGTHVVLRQSALAQALASSLPAAHKRALHERLAVLAETDPRRRLFAADHYFGAELPLTAVDVMLACAQGEGAGRGWHPNYQQLIERGVAICEQYGRPWRDAFALRRSLAQQILNYHEPCERAQLLAISETLCRLSGLSDWYELSEITDPGARLRLALGRAQARYDHAPEHERILPPRDAIPQMVNYLSMLAGFATSSLDVKLLNELPSMAPLAPLAPSIAIVEQLIQSLRCVRSGRTEDYLELQYDLVRRLGQPDAGGLSPNEARALRVGVTYGLAMTEAVMGREIALEHASVLDQHENHVVNAWRARQVVHLFLCDPKAADAARQQVELLQLSQRSRQFHQGATLEGEFMAYLFAEDLLGLRRILPAIEQQAARHPCWRSALLLVQATLQRVRGRPEAALAIFVELLDHSDPHQEALWAVAAAGRVHALLDAERTSEARELGLRYVELCEKHGLRVARHRMELMLALAESDLGEHTSAVERLDRIIADVDQRGFRGLHRGAAYECRARVALAMRDAAAWQFYFAKCAEDLRFGNYPGITARLQRIQEKAQELGLVSDADPSDARHLTREQVATELSGCPREERPRRALDLMLQATGAESGYLYLVTQTGLVLGAQRGATPPPAHLPEVLRHYASAEAQTEQTVDVTCPASFGANESTLEPLLVRAAQGVEQNAVAVLALRFPHGRRWPAPQLMEAIGDQLRSDADAPTHQRSVM